MAPKAERAACVDMDGGACPVEDNQRIGDRLGKAARRQAFQPTAVGRRSLAGMAQPARAGRREERRRGKERPNSSSHDSRRSSGHGGNAKYRRHARPEHPAVVRKAPGGEAEQPSRLFLPSGIGHRLPIAWLRLAGKGLRHMATANNENEPKATGPLKLKVAGVERVFDIDNPVLPDWVDEKTVVDWRLSLRQEAERRGIRKDARGPAGRTRQAAGVAAVDRQTRDDPVRGARRRRQGRHDRCRSPVHEPAHGAQRRADQADRDRTRPMVLPALHRSFPDAGRVRDLRPLLVQPRRRGTRHGLLHARAARAVSEGDAALRTDDRQRGHPLLQVLARHRPGDAAQALPRPAPQPAHQLEVLADGRRRHHALGRLYEGARGDDRARRTRTTRRGRWCARTTSGAHASKSSGMC